MAKRPVKDIEPYVQCFYGPYRETDMGSQDPTGVGLYVPVRRKVNNMKKCSSCQSEIDDKAKKCPKCQSDQRNWFMRHKILTGILGIIGLIIIISIASSGGSDTKTSADTNQGKNDTAQIKEDQTPNVPAEYKSALKKADSYANTQHMSKKGVYNQLTSEYGEKFSKEAAQYAVDNVKTDWNANALAKAKSYQEIQHMSPVAIHDQLTSDFGEKFTKAEADYAIAHLNDQ